MDPDKRIASEQERLDRLHALASSLPFTRGAFTAEDVRVRLGRSLRPRRRRFYVAAAVLALALTHWGAFLIGSGRRPASEQLRNPVAETERILTRASQLDASAPYTRLREELGELRRDIQLASLPARLETISDARAPRFADALAQLRLVLDRFEDPAFRVMMVTNIARASLKDEPPVQILPASTRSYARVVPLGDKRFRVYVVDAARGLMINDEGTLPELQRQHPDIRFVGTGD